MAHADEISSTVSKSGPWESLTSVFQIRNAPRTWIKGAPQKEALGPSPYEMLGDMNGDNGEKD